ncbi:MAG TPA: hypothetical protein VG944_17085 [Fimbriimonas sp.]|nr:hypothetical protein [Fimbriimonas sp.]
MRIRFKKAPHPDRKHSLTCVRDDGSSTGMASSEFFVRHDLGHYAIEAALSSKQAFWGLIASGWDIDSFEEREPGTRKSRTLPPEAVEVEVLAGLLDFDRASGRMAPADLRNTLKEMSESMNCRPPDIGIEVLLSIQNMQKELIRRWEDLAPGDTLELKFPPQTNG